jgi:hypothetical protein
MATPVSLTSVPPMPPVNQVVLVSVAFQVTIANTLG